MCIPVARQDSLWPGPICSLCTGPTCRSSNPLWHFCETHKEINSVPNKAFRLGLPQGWAIFPTHTGHTNLPTGLQDVGAFFLNPLHLFLQCNDPVVGNCKLGTKHNSNAPKTYFTGFVPLLTPPGKGDLAGNSGQAAHSTLRDGTPGSEEFQGVTALQANRLIKCMVKGKRNFRNLFWLCNSQLT